MTPDSVNLNDIEESQLSGENGEVYLFRWLSAAELRLQDAAADYLKTLQDYLETIMLKVINSDQPYPTPGRALRHLVARCFTAIYTRGETRSLFDTLQRCIVIAAETKSPERDMNKIAALHCVGELMLAFGNQYMSFVAEIMTVTLKIFKSSSPPILRYHALVALQKSLTKTRRAVTDANAKDVIKNMKSGLVDKALPVQRAAAEVLISIYSPKDQTIGLADIESIISSCVRSLEGVDQITRRSHARLIGHMLTASQPDLPGNSSDMAKDDPPLPASRQSLAQSSAFSTTDMLAQLSTQFNKSNVSRKVRIGIFDCYSSLLVNLGHAFVENNYQVIVNHLMTEIVSNPRNSTSRHEILFVRKLVWILLRELIGVRMLSEQGQIAAIRTLSNSYLKKWPAMMPGQIAPTSLVLGIILREVASLLQQLGNAPPPVQDVLSDPLLILLGHPSHTVRVNASWTLRCFCYSTPLRLPKTILTVMEGLQRDVTSLVSPVTSENVNFRALGHAYGLAALVSIVPERPLFVSFEINAKVFDIAVQLLKSAGEHDIGIATIEVEVAWIVIAALLSHGPNFVRPYLPQMLVLWRNALPKPIGKDSGTNIGRSAAEWMFLIQVRESALSAILCFLRHNTTLVTLDVGRRIATVLYNALLFANNLVSQELPEASDLTLKGPSLRSREALLRRRAYQCFSAFGPANIPESTQTTLLQSTVSLFSGPDSRFASAVQASIASSAGTFTSVWHSSDGYAYGVTSMDLADEKSISRGDAACMLTHLQLRKPVLGAFEYDSLFLCSTGKDYHTLESTPPATSVVDTAIDLFAQLLPLQDLASISRTLSHLWDSMNSVKAEKNAGRKAATRINAAIGLVHTLRYASRHARSNRETIGSPQVATAVSSFLKDALCDGDPVLRSAASEAIGRLASLADTAFLANQIKSLVDQVVSNRDPHGRAGCALAFGAIYEHVGGLVAGPLLKTTVNVLMSLISDPHPVAHFWALNALPQVITAASLAYVPFVPSTLGLLLKVYSMESHEAEGGTLSNANTSGDFPSYPIVCRIIDAVITILGPDVQESPGTRSLVLSLVREFSLEDDEATCAEAIRCIQHFLMFAPEHVRLPELVGRFRGYLSSSRTLLKLASINALYQLVQKDALSMSRLGGDQLVEDLFGLLDDDSSVEGVMNVISSWLQQTVVHNPSAWIDLCQRIMSRTTASQQVTNAAKKKDILHDDEEESLNIAKASSTRSTPRWRTQLFALRCLHDICSIVSESGRREHYDLPFARKAGLQTSGLLVSRITDLIKMAFTASTAYVTEIRLEGLVVLGDIIRTFAMAPDPVCDGALLLEQHQAPLTAALTPAFSADSTPEIVASAIRVCAIFVGSGIVKDTSRMGRMLKLLTTALEQSAVSGALSLGQVAHLSPNASSMIRISTLSAWAELQVASVQQEYLRTIVESYQGTLASLWLSSLRDYASLRLDSELLQNSSGNTLDSSYSSLGKEVLLPYYVDAWPGILQAVTTSIALGDSHISLALLGTEAHSREEQPALGAQEPCPFFFIIFGLIYEALVNSTTESMHLTSRRPVVLAVLQSLKYLLRPEFMGNALQNLTVFDEFLGLCYRIVMTESAVIQTCLLEAIAVLAIHQNFDSRAVPDTSLTPVQAHCLRMCTYVLRQRNSISGDVSDHIGMITCAFVTFVKVTTVLSSSQREEVRAVAVLLYTEILSDESSDLDIVPSILPVLKLLLELPSEDASAQQLLSRSVHGLLSQCLTNLDAMRGREGPICAKIIKGNLLTAVLVITALPPHIQAINGQMERCCFIISKYLLGSGETVATAAHCAKTLIIASTSGPAPLRYCSKMLLPTAIEYITNVILVANENDVPGYHAAALGEIWKAFSAFLASVAEQHRERTLAILLPATTLLLGTPRAANLAEQSVNQLLLLAKFAPVPFQKATARLEPRSRELLEQSIRRTVGTAVSSTTASTSKPQISLRTF